MQNELASPRTALLTEVSSSVSSLACKLLFSFVCCCCLCRGKTPNEERRMHCLLAVSFTCVCLRLAFICWKGQHFIVFGPFQPIKANRKQTQEKLTGSNQCIRRSAFGVLPACRRMFNSNLYSFIFTVAINRDSGRDMKHL